LAEKCFDAISQFIGFLDDPGKIIKANSGALVRTGLTKEISQKLINKLVSPR
jgi:hypothetical protein